MFNKPNSGAGTIMVKSPVFASAPCKLILSGEHYAVWGSQSLSVPIELRNSATVSLSESAGFIVRRDWGEADLSLPVDEVDPRALFLKGTYDALCGIAKKPISGIEADIPITSNPKGIGNSSSVAAAMAAATLRLLGMPLSPGSLFACAHAADLVAHGGSASGVDARTVTIGSPIVFRKSFEPEKFSFKRASVNMPADSALVLVDTFTTEKCTTKEQIEKFAESFGMEKKPFECSPEERAAVIEDFEPVLKFLLAEFSRPKPSPSALGSLLLENHALLSRHAVSTPEIDSFISECVGAGHAWGGKLTGAGGKGGSLVILAKKAGARGVSAIAESLGFQAFPVSISRQGILVK
ncbi:MAG: hypothetical protein WC506_06890 [Candidatus Micrarchaeia archaeon]